MEAKLLDCTLRDGGYYTNWDFDDKLVTNYYLAMESSPIEYVEIGYRSFPLEGYLGKYFYCPQFVMAKAKNLMPSKKLVVILNEKDIRKEKVSELLKPCKPYITLIRLAVDPINFDRAVELAKIIKEIGFEVAFNLMYMSKWVEDKSFLSKFSGIEDTVDYLYMVDSYGGVTPEDVKLLASEIRKITNVPLGFHGHNNIELALINSITALENGCSIIDSTIMGMGRGAGNLKTELLLSYFSAKYNLKISFQELSSCVSDFELLHDYHNWGTSLPYMISGVNSLPQKDVMSWVGKRRYTINGIVNALQNQATINDKKFNKFNFTEKNKTAIIIGGGNSAVDHQTAVLKVIEKNPDNYIIIHAGVRHVAHYKDVNIPQYYCLVGNEGLKLKKIFANLNQVKSTCVLPPYPREMGTYIPNEIENLTTELPEITFTNKFHDSPLAISVQTALELDISKLCFIGFDGYDTNLNTTQLELSQENQYLFDHLPENISAEFWILTKYRNLKQVSIYSYLN